MKATRLKGFFLNLGLVGLSLLAAALLFEGSLRLFHPQDTRMKSPKGLYGRSARYKRLLTPGFDGSFRRSEFAMKIRVNSLGLRDSEPAEREPVFRILGLGDSFTFGWGVQQEEIYPERIEEALRRRWETDGIDVRNTGVPGYGGYEYLNYLEDHGWKWKPDIVIIGWALHNDVIDVAQYEKRQRKLAENPELASGSLTRQKEKPESLVHRVKIYLGRHSHAYCFVVDRFKATPEMRHFLYRTGITMTEYAEAFKYSTESYRIDRDDRMIQAWARTQKILTRIGAEAKARGVPLLVVLIPARFSVEPERWESLKGQFELNDSDYDLAGPNKRMNEFCARSRLTCLDLRPAFLEATRVGGDLYFNRDDHWTAEGHRLAADLILDRLQKQGFLPDRP